MTDCGLTNLASCLPEMFFNYLLSIISSPLQYLLDLVRSLLSQPVNLNPFLPIWTIIIYLLSMFYSFLIMYSGFNFIISGYDAAKRVKAKEWLRNIIIMIVLVQASFFIYTLINDATSTITASTLSLVPQNFFNLTADSISDFALQLMLYGVYFITILLTLITLLLRYAIISIGVALFPLAIFAYFIPPIREYGSFILNILGSSMFVVILDAVILVGFSKLLEVPGFENMKIILMITAFFLINVAMLFLMFFSLLKAAMNVGTKVMAIAAIFS